MALKSVYLPDLPPAADIIEISEDEHRHLVVGRARLDEQIEVFDGKGNVWTAVVIETAKRRTLARVESHRMAPAPQNVIILAQSLIRSAAFELALEKAVEAGVTRIVPFAAARSNVTGHSRLDRWQRIIVEAAKQSKRFHLPVIEAPMEFSQVLQLPAVSRIVFAEHSGASLKSAVTGSPVLYLIGPEGGWTGGELEMCRAAGFREVTLGSGVLRSETAAVAGALLIRYELGEI